MMFPSVARYCNQGLGDIRSRRAVLAFLEAPWEAENHNILILLYVARSRAPYISLACSHRSAVEGRCARRWDSDECNGIDCVGDVQAARLTPHPSTSDDYCLGLSISCRIIQALM